MFVCAQNVHIDILWYLAAPAPRHKWLNIPSHWFSGQQCNYGAIISKSRFLFKDEECSFMLLVTQNKVGKIISVNWNNMKYVQERIATRLQVRLIGNRTV